MMTAGALAFASCDSDDNNTEQNDDDVLGVYRLAALNAPVAQNLNGDETSWADLTTKYACYADWTITLNEDHTLPASLRQLMEQWGAFRSDDTSNVVRLAARG